MSALFYVSLGFPFSFSMPGVLVHHVEEVEQKIRYNICMKWIQYIKSDIIQVILCTIIFRHNWVNIFNLRNKKYLVYLGLCVLHMLCSSKSGVME